MKWTYMIEIWRYTYLNMHIYIKIYVKCLDQTSTAKFYYWETCGKGMLKIFRFVKIVKEEH